MPDFRKSYKKSKNSKNSKSGGRRRKHTMRKYRRGRKVMRGGVVPSNPHLSKKMSELFDKNVFNMKDVEQFITDNGLPSPANISNMTYLELQRYVSQNDTSVDEPTTSHRFNATFKLPDS